MTPLERTYYLANILLFSTNSTPDLVQDKLLAHICKGIEAETAEMLQAGQLMQQNHRLTAVGCYSERVKNLEDILFFTMSTGYLNDTGKIQMLKFAKNLGISQIQMRIIAQEAKTRFTMEKQWIDCSQCAIKIPAHSKFCPECGAQQENRSLKHLSGKVAKTEKIDESAQIKVPKTGLCVKFNTQAASEALLIAARACQKYQTVEIHDVTWAAVSWAVERTADMLPLLYLLDSHEQRFLYLDGLPQSWQECFAFLACVQQRQRTFNAAEHCFGINENRLNIWGCKQAGMDWVADSEWLTYGEFETLKLFLINKKRIQHSIEHNLRGYRFCPHLSLHHVNLALHEIADKILIDSENWKHQEVAEETLHSFKVTDTSSDATRYIIGITPIGFTEASKIVEKVFPKSAIKQLLKRKKGITSP
jgi:Zn finger protein HypA/HybF involved in hydrogenase expression